MTAITTDKGRIQAAHPASRMIKRKAQAEKIPMGALVSIDASGYAENSTATASLVCIGVCAEECDNSAGSAGDIDCKVLTGLFWFTNSGTNAVAQTHMDELCYVEDNNTVGSSSSSTHAAGYVRGVDATKGVLVAVGLGNVI